MKKFFTYALAILLCVAFATPLVSASSEIGSGSARTVTFHDSFVNCNTSVVVPTVLNNETDNNFAFVVMNEDGWGCNYTFSISICDNNATWYNDTVDVVGIPSENTTGYINFTANTFDLVDNANITITMQWQNLTSSNDDVWYGTVDVVDSNTYAIRVTTTEMMIVILSFGLVILFIGKVLGSMKDWGDTKKDKK